MEMGKLAPDGGLRAWMVVLGSWCLLFVSAGWINCELLPLRLSRNSKKKKLNLTMNFRTGIGVFQTQYEQHTLSAYHSSTLAWIPSLETFILFSSGLLVGKLYDNSGPFYIILVGTFLHIFGVMMISVGQRYYEILLAQGVCSASWQTALWPSSMQQGELTSTISFTPKSNGKGNISITRDLCIMTNLY